MRQTRTLKTGLYRKMCNRYMRPILSALERLSNSPPKSGFRFSYHYLLLFNKPPLSKVELFLKKGGDFININLFESIFWLRPSLYFLVKKSAKLALKFFQNHWFEMFANMVNVCEINNLLSDLVNVFQSENFPQT